MSQDEGAGEVGKDVRGAKGGAADTEEEQREVKGEKEDQEGLIFVD